MTVKVNGRDPRTSAPWELDLSNLAVGGGGAQTFRGRPALLERLLPGFEAHVQGVSESTAYREKSQLIYFWRFLDDLESVSCVFSGDPVLIDDLDSDEIEVVWKQFITWLRKKPATKMSSRTRYYINSSLYSIWSRAFQAAHLTGATSKSHIEIYVYFKHKKNSSYEGHPLDFDEAKSAFRVLANSWRSILKKIERGRSLALKGCNPMVGSGGGGSWKFMANRLWAANEYLLVTRSQDKIFLKKLRDGLSEYAIDDEWRIPNLAQVGTGFNAYLPCLCLTRQEIAVAMAMVTMKTGLNPDAVARMEIDSWYRPDALSPDNRVIIFGPKRTGKYNLQASSSTTRLTDPYLIIQRIIEIQAPLRRRLLAEAERSNDRALRDRAKLVWLFPDFNGQISDFVPGVGRNTDSAAAHKMLDEIFETAGVRRNDGTPLQYKFSDGRDIWGLFVYHKSGFNNVLTAQALGHSSLASLLHYLDKRVTRIEDRKRLIDLHARVLADLGAGKYEPKRLRALQEGLTETAATGLHCTDPQNPDPEADPGNPGGRTCGAQGCWACSKWFGTKESVPYLLKIIADLESIRESMSVALWETSDYPSMQAIYEHILNKFDPSIIDAGRKIADTLPAILVPRQFIGRV